MDIDNLLVSFYGTSNETEAFDLLCSIQCFIESNTLNFFLEERIAHDGSKIYTLQDKYGFNNIIKIFENQLFKKSIHNLLKHQETDVKLSQATGVILKDGCFVNLLLDGCFYFASSFPQGLKQIDIDYLGKTFELEINKLEKEFLYEFSKVEILNILESVVFHPSYHFTKKFAAQVDGTRFYSSLKKARLIVGNYLADFSTPILLSKSFKGIMATKRKLADKFSLKDALNRLKTIVKKYQFFTAGFQFTEAFVDLSNFDYFFKNRETSKELFLLSSVIDGLNDFTTEEILTKINDSGRILSEMIGYFYNKYNVFPEYKGTRGIKQWSNKSFLNTIKFLSLLSVIDHSSNDRWKIDVFLKYFDDWICDLNENINYYASNLDDYDSIKQVLLSGEGNTTEFKATFGLPIEDCKNQEALKKISKEVVEKIAKNILAMANTEGGNIFIGIVEKIDRVREDIAPNIVARDCVRFLDIHTSLQLEGSSFDAKRLQIQDILKELTKERIDYLDSLFGYRFYKIYIEGSDSYVEILCICVKKSDRLIYLKQETSWITLPKRLNGRVELINPADELLDQRFIAETGNS